MLYISVKHCRNEAEHDRLNGPILAVLATQETTLSYDKAAADLQQIQQQAASCPYTRVSVEPAMEPAAQPSQQAQGNCHNVTVCHSATTADCTVPQGEGMSLLPELTARLALAGNTLVSWRQKVLSWNQLCGSSHVLVQTSMFLCSSGC